MSVFIVGEDGLCCALASALVLQIKADVEIAQTMNTKGCSQFAAKIASMNQVALNVMPVLMIADGDQAACPVQQMQAWMPANVSPSLMVRLAVKEAESWVLADHDGFQEFAKIHKKHLPHSPENLVDPKQTLLAAISHSTNKNLKDEMLPAKGVKHIIGLGYNLHLANFVATSWNAKRASLRAPSLARAIPKINGVLNG